MRLIFVVPRYGLGVLGGAELFCRGLATRLAGRGHDMTVVTSSAVSYVDWANVLDAGASEDEGVMVHRLPVAHPRDPERFNRLHDRVLARRPHPPAPLLQEAWMRAQGPWIADLPAWFEAHASSADAVAFFPYLYATTWLGLPAASRAGLPTVLHPCAHDEPPLHLPIFDGLLRRPDGYAFLTPEEAELFRTRVRRPIRSLVVGTGIAPPPALVADAASAGGGDPFLLFLGRVEPGKGTNELFDYFTTYKQRRPGALRLVLAGEPVAPPPPHPDVDVLGAVDERQKWALFGRARLLVLPSYFESFSMVLAEAWSTALPAVVQGRCTVLAGQARRSRGAFAYDGYPSFEAALDRLLDDDTARRAMGQAGKRYVEGEYAWPAVLDRYEGFLDAVVGARAR